MNKDKRNNIKLLGTLNNADESGIIANANQIYDANEDKSTQDVSKEHTERIKTLEDKEDSMQTTLENITKTGEASAASNVTYNHSDSKLDATNVQQAIDEVRKKSNYNDGDNIIDFNTIHLITDNPEFAIAAVDANDRILYGIKADGQPYWGVGVPKVVRDYVDKQVNDILGTDNITEAIDSLKEVEKFLSDFKNSDTLKALLDIKANKTEVDNTIANINANIADIYKKSNPNDEEGNVIDTNSIKSVVNNPEYFKAFVDNTNKLIEAIGLDGVRKFFAGINIQDISQCVIDNPDYLIAWTDKENKVIFAIQRDGNPYFGYGVPKVVRDYVDKQVISTKTVFDISAYHATGGTLATYDNLEDALGANGKNIPQSLKKGGMSVKFVQTSDNKYVQYRLMSDTFNTIVANWQGIDDKPIVGSNNLVKSGGIYDALQNNPRFTLFKKENIAKSPVVASAEQIITGIYLENADGTPVEYTKEIDGVTYYLGILSIRQGNPNNNIKRTVSIGYAPMDGTSRSFNRLVIFGNTETISYVGVEHMIAHDIQGFKTVEIWVDWDKYDETLSVAHRYCLYDNISNGSITTYRYKRDYKYTDIDEISHTGNGTIVVDASGGGDYTSLQEAIFNAGDSAAHPKTIIVLPGTYIMSAYNDDTRHYGANRYLSIIGTDKHNCIIRNDNGYYNTSPYVDNGTLKLQGNVYLANLTIINTDDNFEPPSGITPEEAENWHRAYCVHFDFSAAGGTICEIHNCVLENDHYACVGCGNRGKLIFTDCMFKTRNYNPSNTRGCIYTHDSNGSSFNNTEIIVKNCILDADYNCITALNARKNKMYMTFVGNVMISQNNQSVINNFSTTYFELTKFCYGNNSDAINYQNT